MTSTTDLDIAACHRAALDATREVVVGIGDGQRLLDVAVHGWDLAVATEQPSPLTPEIVAACLQILEPQLDALRASGMFGTEQPIPADADATTRLLLTLGRTPS